MADAAIAVVNTAPVAPLERHTPALTNDELEVLRATVLAGASDAQLRMYAISCNRRGLDPFSKEVYGFVNREGGIELVVSIEGLRKKAEESGEYMGQSQQQWCGPDGEWQDVWLRNDPPAAARITVHRAGHESFTGVALWKEFGRPGAQNWKQYPTVMLSKCSEASAIRHLFPNQTQGLYITEEVPDPALEAKHRVAAKSGPSTAARGAAPIGRRVDRQTGEITTVKPFDPASEHEAGWRQYVLQRKDELGITIIQFNTLRRQLKLPLVERMDVHQCRELYDAMLKVHGDDPELDAAGVMKDLSAAADVARWADEAEPIDAPFTVDGEAGADPHTD